MNLEEIKKRSEVIQSLDARNKYRSDDISWAAQTILQLVAEVELLRNDVIKKENLNKLRRCGEGHVFLTNLEEKPFSHSSECPFCRKNNKLTNANKILRERINSAIEFDSHYPMKDLLLTGLAEADEVMK